MNEVKVSSWNELNDVLFKDWYNKKIGRFRAPMAFRGLSNSNYKLKTSLMRIRGPYWKLEPHLLINFRRYSGIETVQFDSMWNWMSIGQHHGLPTRLLDWTYSPIIATHFATANINNFGLDGVIWAINFEKAQDFLPIKFKEESEKINSPVFPIESLDNIIKGDTKSLDKVIEVFEKLKSMSDLPFLIFMEPPSIDDRIRNQFALFSFMSDPKICLDDWLKDQNKPGLWLKIIIPSDLKGEIRDKLDQSNISERTLFPGLDGTCKWLTRHYSTLKK
ncbi:MAG: FRG domain-containing protein [Candidatus Helarchaeota archaeon]